MVQRARSYTPGNRIPTLRGTIIPGLDIENVPGAGEGRFGRREIKFGIWERKLFLRCICRVSRVFTKYDKNRDCARSNIAAREL